MLRKDNVQVQFAAPRSGPTPPPRRPDPQSRGNRRAFGYRAHIRGTVITKQMEAILTSGKNRGVGYLAVRALRL